MNVKLKPFSTPNFVIGIMPPGTRENGIEKLPSWPLSVVSVEELDKMCNDFRAEVFKKAGKTDPYAK